MNIQRLALVGAIGLSTVFGSAAEAVAEVWYTSIENAYHGGRLVTRHPDRRVWIYAEPSVNSESCGYGVYLDSVQIRDRVLTEKEGVWYLAHFAESDTTCWVDEAYVNPTF